MDTVKRVVRVILDWTLVIFGFFFPDKKGRDYLPPITNPVLVESATSLAKKIKSRELKSQHVVRAFIDRIRSVDHLINAVVYERFSEALKEAEEIDRLLDSGEARELLNKPFLGVPFTGKDCAAVKGLPQTCGLVCRKDFIAEEDSFPVKQLKEYGGAICIGITNCPELCFWFDSDNMIKGRTNNPYDLSRIPGGSSGGTGAVVAYAGSLFGVGTDIAGSIRIPSFSCGIYGHKPTPRVIDPSGHYPLSFTHEDRLDLFTYGPMCRYVEDLTPAFKVMAGEEAEKRYLPKVGEPVDFKKVKVFYSLEASDPFCTPVQEEIKESIRAAVDHMRLQGCSVQEYNIEELRYGMDLYTARYFSKNIPPDSQNVLDNKGEINVWAELGKKIFGLSNHTLPMLSVCLLQKMIGNEETPKILELRETVKTLKTKFHKLLGEDGIFLFPPYPEVALKHHTTIPKLPIPFVYTGIFSILEVPVTSVPLGLNSKGIPLGVQVVAGPFNDHLTLATAVELDKKFGGWIPPSRVLV